MIATRPATVEEFRRQLEGFLAYHETEASIWTREQWKERKEFIMPLAPLHMTFNATELACGGLCDEPLIEFVRAYGWEHERGYASSIHFWPEGHHEQFSDEEREAARLKERAGWDKHLEHFDPMCD